MTILQQRLVLTPKASSPLGAVPLRPEIARLVDPNPDFDLVDIRLELQDIESKLGTPGPLSQEIAAPGSAGKRFGGNVSDVADFGRKGFRISLWDIDSDDSDEDSEKENVVSTNVGIQEQDRQDQTPPRGIDTERFEWGSSPLLPKTDETEAALLEVNRERLLRVQDDTKQQHLNFVEKFREEQQRVAARFAQLERER